MAGPNYGLLDNALVSKNRALEGFGGVNALMSQVYENQAAQMGLENALIERAAGQAGGGDINKTAQLLAAGGRPREGAALMKFAADAGKAKTEEMAARLPIFRDMSRDMAFDPSDQNIQSKLTFQVQNGWITPQEAQQRWSNVSKMNPEQRKEMFLNNAVKAEDLLSTQLRQREADTAERRLQFEMNPTQQAGIAQAKATGTETGKSAAKAAADLPGAVESATRGIALIDEMIGDTTVNERGQLVYGKKKPHAGFESYVGGTLLPGARFIEGGDTASFELRQKQIEGQAFLDAFQTLKGGGQITEKEGEKATAAISRMNKAASEVEYVKAARELQEVLREGVKRAKTKAARGGAGAPLPKNKWASALAEFEAQENQ